MTSSLRYLVRTCWIAVVAMVSLALVPTMATALAASTLRPEAVTTGIDRGLCQVEVVAARTDRAPDLRAHARSQTVLRGESAALATARWAGWPVPGLHDEPTPWPQQLAQPTLRPLAWSSSQSRAPPTGPP